MAPHRQLVLGFSFFSWRTLAACIIVSALTAGGCALPQKNVSTPPFATKEADVTASLMEAANSIQKDLSVLTSIETKRLGSPESGPVASVEPGSPLATAINLQWSGPLVPALSAVGGLIGFAVSEVGAKPSSPPLVHVDAVNQQAVSVLSDIGSQAGVHVGINVDEAARTIEVVYLGRNM